MSGWDGIIGGLKVQEPEVWLEIGSVLFAAAAKWRSFVLKSSVEQEPCQFAPGSQQFGALAGIGSSHCRVDGTEKSLLHDQVEFAFQLKKIL